MCFINISKVENKQDVQNLVTGLILRQEAEFTEHRIIELAKKHLNKSSYGYNDRDLKGIVRDTLDYFKLDGDLTCKQGTYLLNL